MKAPTAIALITVLFACASGTQPSANAPANQPSNVTTTESVANQPNQSTGQQSSATTTSAQQHGATGTNANAGASRAASEATPAPPKTGTEGHGLLPKPGAPAPTNTGDPCGACNTPPGSR